MNHDALGKLSALDWDEIGPRLLAFTCRWAANVYGWQAGTTLPNGMSIEDIARDAVAAFATGERTLNARFDIVVQLKGAVRSILWNVYHKTGDKLTSGEEPAFFDAQLEMALDPAARAASDDFCRRFIEQLSEDELVARNLELRNVVKAYAEGAESVEDVAEETGLPVKRVYELRRNLKEAATRVLRVLKRKETVI